MWILELSLTNDAERLAARATHRDRLRGLHARGIVRMAGPLADDSGAVIILDLPDRPAVDALVAADPYFATIGTSVRQLRDWRPFLH